MSELLRIVFNPASLALMIPLAAVIGSFIIKGQKLHYEHQERLARIEMGLDPDLA